MFKQNVKVAFFRWELTQDWHSNSDIQCSNSIYLVSTLPPPPPRNFMLKNILGDLSLRARPHVIKN